MDLREKVYAIAQQAAQHGEVKASYYARYQQIHFTLIESTSDFFKELETYLGIHLDVKNGKLSVASQIQWDQFVDLAEDPDNLLGQLDELSKKQVLDQYAQTVMTRCSRLYAQTAEWLTFRD